MISADKLRVSLEPGYAFTTARRTITETDIVNYSGLSNDFDPLHIDEEFAKRGPFGRRIAHGQLIASIVTGLRSELDAWPVISYLGTSRRFTGPVGAQDTISGVYSVENVRPTSANPKRLVVTLGLVIRDQNNVQVMEGQDVVLVDTEGEGND
ncbi:MaoC family dehydratase [Rhodococcus sp. NPDC057529]|uniref:MaoC family dehydratase n=1 Tax=Rhodococcus sp. NPDC057529 TaxID=3346158 RepID=UPI00366BFFF2